MKLLSGAADLPYNSTERNHNDKAILYFKNKTFKEIKKFKKLKFTLIQHLHFTKKETVVRILPTN